MGVEGEIVVSVFRGDNVFTEGPWVLDGLNWSGVRRVNWGSKVKSLSPCLEESTFSPKAPWFWVGICLARSRIIDVLLARSRWGWDGWVELERRKARELGVEGEIVVSIFRGDNVFTEGPLGLGGDLPGQESVALG